MKQIIFHIDVNSAFLSWTAIQKLQEGELLDLRTVPSIIGGDIEKRHGVVLAKSIPAKDYSINTGEPIVNAMRKCPSLIVAAPNHHLYSEKSRQFIAYLSTLCPSLEQVSIDECFMDFTPIASDYESPKAAADFIKNEISDRFGFTVNIGISDKKVLAKMASDFKKPNLVHTLFSSEIKEKMWPLPVSSLYMCGKSSVEALRNLGIVTIGDLACSNLPIITSHLKSHGHLLWNYANGVDDSFLLTQQTEAKGIGSSTTLPKDAITRADALPPLRQLSDSVSFRLREAGQLACMISVEIKYSDFTSCSHQMLLPSPTATNEAIYKASIRLFDELWNESPVRLLGIRTSKLVSCTEPVQLNLFQINQKEPESEKQRKLDLALDSIKHKYGKNAVVRGSLASQTFRSTDKKQSSSETESF